MLEQVKEKGNCLLAKLGSERKQLIYHKLVLLALFLLTKKEAQDLNKVFPIDPERDYLSLVGVLTFSFRVVNLTG